MRSAARSSQESVLMSSDSLYILFIRPLDMLTSVHNPCRWCVANIQCTGDTGDQLLQNSQHRCDIYVFCVHTALGTTEWCSEDRHVHNDLCETGTGLRSVCLLVGCLTSKQHASVSQGRICSDKFTCCHTEIEVADPTFYLNHSQYTDTVPTSSSADLIMPGVWQGSHWSANF